MIESTTRIGSSVIARGTKTCLSNYKYFNMRRIFGLNHCQLEQSASNDFWGKTFMDLYWETNFKLQASSSMVYQESFVVVPFELVKIESVVRLSVGIYTNWQMLQDKTSTYLQRSHGRSETDNPEGWPSKFSVCMLEWSQPSGGERWHTLIRVRLYSFRHVYWNGGYFGCIHQVKALLPKPDVCALLMTQIRTQNL